MHRLEISLLGPIRVALDGEPVTRFRGDTARALLAYLAVRAGTPCRRDSLAALLWPDDLESVGLQNLRQALRRLRVALGDEAADPPFLDVTRETLALNAESEHWLDVAAFSEAIAASKGHAHRRLETCPTCVKRLREAVALYRGEFLAVFSLPSTLFEEWMVVEREHLHGQALEALAALAAYCEGCEEYDEAIAYARRQVELEPWREEAHRQWMRALALSGQRSAALAQYKACVRILGAELGVEPAPETTALYERIREGAELRLVSATPPHNLPAQLTPFIGREALLAEIADRLEDPACRLLTLVGPGGSGKTRLALEAAARQLDNYPDGVFFVSLAPLQAAEAIIPTIAQALAFGLYGEGEPREQLLNYLRRKRMLLVLDNYEHLLEGADVAADILKTAPGVKVLVTSRFRLNVTGEQLSPVRGMDYPETLPKATTDLGQYQAVRLFLSSAQRVRPGYQPAGEDLVRVGEICRLVEGMPLALLLAAAWMEMLTPTEIARELTPENGPPVPGRGIDFLEADLRDIPERQRSMHAVFDHSWTLLAQQERRVFAGLSVLRGGFTQEAAQHVTGASLRDLLVLVNRSLLYRTPAGRYEIHELLRQYAAERLAQSPDAGETARDRHAAFYAAALEQWAIDLRGARQQAALAEMEADIENARASWIWAAGAGQTERLGQAIDGLGLFYEMHGPYLDGQVLCQTAANSLAAAASGHGLRLAAKILAWQSAFSRWLGQTEKASRLLRQGLSTLERADVLDQDTRPERAFTLSQMGEHLFDSDPETAKLSYTQSLALYRSLDDRWGIARVLSGLGLIAMNSGDYDQAQKLEQESLALARAQGNRAGMREPLQWLAYTAMKTGQWEEAERLGREHYAIYQEMGGPSSLAMGLTTFGAQLFELAKFTEARPMIEEGLAISEHLGWRRGVAWSNMHLGQIEMHRGLYKQARVSEQTALALFRELNRWGTTVSLRLLGQIALAEGAYAEAQRRLQESAAISRELGRPDELCDALSGLGCVAHRLGHTFEAQEHLRAALRIAVETPERGSLTRVLSAVAPFLADRGMKERAVELYALALLYPLAAISRWFEDVAGRQIAAVAATLPPEMVAAAQERGRALDLSATVKELLTELEG